MPLRDVFVYTGLIALAFGSMRIGSIPAAIIVFLVLVIYSFRWIIVFVGTKDERPIAIGFVVPTTVYGIVLALVGSTEFDVHSPVLIASQLAGMTVPFVRGGMATIWEMMSLFHAISAILLGAAGSFFAQETVRRRATQDAKCEVSGTQNLKPSNSSKLV